MIFYLYGINRKIVNKYHFKKKRIVKEMKKMN